MSKDDACLTAIAWLICRSNFTDKKRVIKSDHSGFLSDTEAFKILRCLIPNSTEISGEDKYLKDYFDKLNLFLGQDKPKRDVYYLISDDGLGLSILVNIVRIRNWNETFGKGHMQAPRKQKSMV